jgi:hypothetical protein
VYSILATVCFRDSVTGLYLNGNYCNLIYYCYSIIDFILTVRIIVSSMLKIKTSFFRRICQDNIKMHHSMRCDHRSTKILKGGDLHITKLNRCWKSPFFTIQYTPILTLMNQWLSTSFSVNGQKDGLGLSVKISHWVPNNASF